MSGTKTILGIVGCLSVLGALVLTGKIVFGQDAIEVAADQYEVILENDKVRVLRGTYAPGAMSAMHEHPGSVVVTMTDGSLRITGPDGQVVNQFLQKGRVAWSGGSHSIENTGNEELVVIIVEVKNTSFLERVFGD